uniref:Uncharacterized protein n=1 Tax=Sphaerodactylus townsendi TaxID=933632 RepID=A0ACB8FZT1_9SAUR
MDTPAWHHSGYSLDSKTMTGKKASPHTRKTSKMKCDDYVFLTEKQIKHETAENITSVGTDCSLQVSSKNVRMSRGVCEKDPKGWNAEPLCSEQCTATPAHNNKVSSPMFKRQHSEETGSRKVSVLLYRLEETKLSITTREGGIHPSEQTNDFPEPERKREMTGHSRLLTEMNNCAHQESFEGEAAGVSANMINNFQGMLQRQITRSDSESSVENRQVNKLTLNSPGDENKSSALGWFDSKEPRNGEMDFPPMQSKEEIGGQLATFPSNEGGSFTQLVDYASRPDSAPDGCHVSAKETADNEKGANGLEIKVSAELQFASVSEEAEKHSRQNDSCAPERGVGDEMRPASYSNGHAGCLQTDVAESQPAESPQPTAPMLLELRDPPHEDATEGFPSTAPDVDRILQGQTEEAKSQEDEKALKVADVKKTFEKCKPAAEKAAPPARKATHKNMMQHHEYANAG